jgi:beta-mannanase
VFIDVSCNDLDLISVIEIYNIEGKLIYAEAINETKSRIDISKLKTGKYILKAKTDNKTITKKFIKMD